MEGADTALKQKKRVVAPPVPAGQVQGLVDIAQEVDQEAEVDVAGLENRGNSLWSVHQRLRLVHDRSEDIHILVHPPVLTKRAQFRGVVELRWRQRGQAGDNPRFT